MSNEINTNDLENIDIDNSKSAGSGTVVTDTYFADHQTEGFSAADLKTPFLNLQHSQSAGVQEGKFKPGEFVYDKETVVEQPATIVFAKLAKYYMEKLPFGSEVTPQYAKDIEDVRNRGGVLLLEKNKLSKADQADTVFWVAAATATILIEWPEDADGALVVELGGKLWAPAQWTLTSYNYDLATLAFKAGVLNKLGLSGPVWSLKSKVVPRGKFQVWTPFIDRIGRNDEAFIKALGETGIV